MDNRDFNSQRYNRRKTGHHIVLGFQQMVCNPMINVIWLPFIVLMVLFAIGMNKLFANVEVNPLLASVFFGMITFLKFFFPGICTVGVIQLIGEITAIKDEADMSLVFGDRRDVKNLTPILTYKRVNRKTGVTKREFYSAIPMERWQEKREAICDRMDIHLIGEISYGGKKRNKGDRIYFESGRGRKPVDRGIIYDDTF